ncbi:unnamed protein product, partial [Thlaspi arvense]
MVIDFVNRFEDQRCRNWLISSVLLQLSSILHVEEKSVSFVFSLQHVRDTREKQIQLWEELIFDYCKTQKVFLIGVEEDFPLFSNSSID